MKSARSFLLLVFSFCILNVHAQKKPNIILILADDMGYSDIGSYGGEVQTPNIDQLAREGLRYRQFYNAARCCPTRASLISGLYPHQAGMGWMAAADLGTPAYQDDLNQECVTIAEVLRNAGYSTYMTGKWHLTNERKIDGMVTESWPRQRGFDRYFGIIPGGANYFTPMLYSDNKRYKAPDNFYLTNAIADTSVKYLEDHMSMQKDKPFFMYVAFTSPHWPLHALQPEIDKYRDVYTRGWDVIRQERFARQKAMGLISASAVLSPRDEEVPAWETLSADGKKDMAMRMAVYAAQIDIMDQGIGRIVAKLKEEHQLDNTLIFFLSDNGACAEFISSGNSKVVDGSAETFESYRINWANVSSTPFKEFKHYTYEGGIATPLIIHWPKGIPAKLDNSLVADYGHITDIMATCVDVSGAKYPTIYKGHQIHPMEGKSLVPNFTGNHNNRNKVYWEHEANIALRDGKWKLVAKTPPGAAFNDSSLHLYDMETDPTEMNNLASKYPDRVKSMYADWMKWAKRIHAFPFDTREYGERMRDYKRRINGSFNDNLGGWNIKKGPAVQASIIIDSTSQINGKKSALVSMEKSNDKAAGLLMNWSFPASKGETFLIRLKVKANRKTSFSLQLDTAADHGEKLMEKEIAVSTSTGSVVTQATTLPKDGNYRISFYLGKLAEGDKVWIDDVELVPVKK